MAPYPVNLPLQLQHEVEQYAMRQGVSPDQFILWAIAEKVEKRLKREFTVNSYCFVQ
jgi:hypothetical protein